MQLATLPARAVAWFIDGIVLSMIAGTVFRIIGTPYFGSLTGLLFIEWVLYHGYFWTHHQGQTPGKMLVGIRVVKKDGSAIFWADAVVRCFGYFFNSALLSLGWLWVLVDKQHQGFHDKLANTFVVKA
jgi:uncharacterized RDD family membrane protein YckC